MFRRVPAFAQTAPLAIAAMLLASPGGAQAPWSAPRDMPAAVALAGTGASKKFLSNDMTAGSEAGATTTIDVSRAIAQRLEEWTQSETDSARRARRNAIAAYYAKHDFAPLWRLGEYFSPAATRAAQTLRDARRDALRISAPIPSNDAQWSVAAELDLSEGIVDYAAQASGARVDPARISRLIGARPRLASASEALDAVTLAGADLADFNPPHAGYRALRDKLAELRTIRENSGRVALASRGNDIGPQNSFASLTQGEAKRIEAEIIANMERWRWEPRDLGATRIEVNIPQFELALTRDGVKTHRTRVVVGKTTTPTPVFFDKMRYVVINPSWSVPQSIITKEMAGKHGGDLSYLAARGFKVSYSNGRASVRQPPGEKNALGRVKFVFPNEFSVYLHDTPSRSLFATARRAYSHGCVRVDQPFALAEAVLTADAGWTEKRLRGMIGASERRIDLARPMPVHIEYFTATVDADGQLRLFDDIYGYSARVREALASGS
ncbi:L,D-transpeptidase family protein [Methylocystis sp. WRRC1]|uniref:L,D-transpeptidase family protein n=1 Tax=Methylocystis sp. WRRC1 TaxID=1732014 RepID=UPI001D140529|nr:L,D-transpeptidase family protein [Methylocystis sp. WRRC1]MCC3247415.1 L,D-transpeptidase family protein [Methylocystis sp. WRRC1]